MSTANEQIAAVPPNLRPTILTAIVGCEGMAESFGQLADVLASRSDRRAFRKAQLAAQTLANRLRDLHYVLAGDRRP